jgi:hypothetical protein
VARGVVGAAGDEDDPAVAGRSRQQQVGEQEVPEVTPSAV